MGAILREQNTLPYGDWITKNLTAKAAIDNCRAGRAAKGASPASSSKKIQSTFVGCIFLVFYNNYTNSVVNCKYCATPSHNI